MNVPFSIADKRRMKGIKLITDILHDIDDIILCIHSNACTTERCMFKTIHIAKVMMKRGN